MVAVFGNISQAFIVIIPLFFYMKNTHSFLLLFFIFPVNEGHKFTSRFHSSFVEQVKPEVIKKYVPYLKCSYLYDKSPLLRIGGVFNAATQEVVKS